MNSPVSSRPPSPASSQNTNPASQTSASGALAGRTIRQAVSPRRPMISQPNPQKQAIKSLAERTVGTAFARDSSLIAGATAKTLIATEIIDKNKNIVRANDNREYQLFDSENGPNGELLGLKGGRPRRYSATRFTAAIAATAAAATAATAAHTSQSYGANLRRDFTPVDIQNNLLATADSDICVLLSSRKLSKLANRINSHVGSPATRDPRHFVSRDDMKLKSNEILHLDVGGEGAQKAYGLTSGFKDAININAKRYSSQYQDKEIPNLVLLQSWDSNPPLPFSDGSADRITLQGAPLTDHNVNEIARVLAPNGRVDLWVDNYFSNNIQKLAGMIGARIELQNRSDCPDEYKGGSPGNNIKCCLIKY